MDPHMLSLLLLFPLTDGLLSSYTLESWTSSDLARPRVHRAKPALGRIPDPLICKLITAEREPLPDQGISAFECTVNLLSGLNQKSKALVFKCQPQTSSLKEAGWGQRGRSLPDHGAGVCRSRVLALRPQGLPRASFLLALPTGSRPPLRPPEGRSPAGFQTSGLENCGRVDFCCCKPPVCGQLG